ncbi:MAG: class I SAM-dependent methyltransferase [Proteobacteria bacterium]|nr:class I SAM-dependent methyltransferase [Pseudomonadota bacterium]
MENIKMDRAFEYENGFYLTSSVDRISKFATHMDLFRKVSHLAGDIVECGVFKGVSLSRWIKFRALFNNPFSKKIIAFDVFGEFPEAGYDLDKKKRDQFINEAGSKGISKEKLIAILKRLELYQNIELIKGNVLETIPEYVENNYHIKISLLHIDVDLYEPTKMALEVLYPHVVRGGIVILDDYGAFPGANKAVDDFFSAEKIRIQKLPYSHAISFMEKS